MNGIPTGTDAADELPQGWASSCLDEIGIYQNGRAFKSSEWSRRGRPIIRIQDLTGSKENPNFFEGDVEERYIVHAGDFLISWAATLDAYIWQGPEGVLNQHIFKVRSRIFAGFHFLLVKHMLQRLYAATHGSGMVHITKGRFGHSTVPVPPLAEQKRIVGKVEELLGRVNAARERLGKVPGLLKRFRQSVLAAACSGQLTAEWREGKAHSSGPISRLAAIAEQRRLRWTQTRLVNQKHGRSSTQKGGGGTYAEPPGLDATELPSLPQPWEWVRAEQVCDFITKGTTPSWDKMTAERGDVPFIKVYNLTHTGALDFSIKPTFVDRRTNETGPLARSRIRPGDVLMNLVGPPLGKVAVVPDIYPEWNTNQAVAIYRPVPGMDGRFFALALLTDDILGWATSRSKATVGQHNLTLELARDLPIPLPPLAEQHEIVRRVEELFALADKIEARVKAATARVEKITQAVLAKAFRGELVPTEAELARREGREYEPASALLARIAGEKETLPPRRQGHPGEIGQSQPRNSRKPRKQREREKGSR